MLFFITFFLATFRSSTGANVFLCSEEGSKIALHEVIAREFTNLFDLFDFRTEKNLRDPFGNYVFIFQGLSKDILEGLRDFLYTGVAYLPDQRSKQTLLNLLNKDLMHKLFQSNQPKIIKLQSAKRKSEIKNHTNKKPADHNHSTPIKKSKVKIDSGLLAGLISHYSDSSMPNHIEEKVWCKINSQYNNVVGPDKAVSVEDMEDFYPRFRDGNPPKKKKKISRSGH